MSEQLTKEQEQRFEMWFEHGGCAGRGIYEVAREAFALRDQLSAAHRQIAVLGPEVRAWREYDENRETTGYAYEETNQSSVLRYKCLQLQAATDALANADPALARLLGGRG